MSIEAPAHGGPSGPRFDPELYALRPWYHDFSALGFDTTFLDVPLTARERLQRAGQVVVRTVHRLTGGFPTSPLQGERARSIQEILRRVPSSHLLNQPVKEIRLMSLLERAVSKLGPSPHCLELFSADGFYSCRLKSRWPQLRVTGVELDRHHVRRAETIARRLELHDVEFVQDDVSAFLERSETRYDLVLCAGGLYHVSDPVSLLQQIGRVARDFVVLQSVVTLETENEGYFVRPAPGWRHGCRFTHAWLRDRLHELGWRFLDESRAQLPGNRRSCDRGSSFFLCRVA